jgi:hypothetical protein
MLASTIKITKGEEPSAALLGGDVPTPSAPSPPPSGAGAGAGDVNAEAPYVHPWASRPMSIINVLFQNFGGRLSPKELLQCVFSPVPQGPHLALAASREGFPFPCPYPVRPVAATRQG